MRNKQAKLALLLQNQLNGLAAKELRQCFNKESSPTDAIGKNKMSIEFEIESIPIVQLNQLQFIIRSQEFAQLSLDTLHLLVMKSCENNSGNQIITQRISKSEIILQFPSSFFPSCESGQTVELVLVGRYYPATLSVNEPLEHTSRNRWFQLSIGSWLVRMSEKRVFQLLIYL